MAKSSGVWGIDIGQCALKALRCSPRADDPSQIIADAFDYIEYSKILSQPEAEPVELIRDAIQQFLSRNELRGDRVAISVSGQSGLARFIKLPPVESKKIPDIVKYEARQQIPFSLEDVVWDYQQLAGGSEDDGFALETEVGLFAMKRDQVFRALKPLDDAGIKVDFIQLTPLAIYNYIVFDHKLDATPIDEYDPDDPPPSTVVISLGTDTTDLVVTNGYRVWQRSIPIGGNHFTKALTKELRLTFSKAEHLKRHATEAENPKAIFQAMRPVFSDLLTEIQRSIGYFSSMDQSAKIGSMVALGNAVKLPGLVRYLSQNLGHDVEPIATFRGLTGSAVTGSPQFKDNLLSFATCYGLCLQGLKKSSISTNLLPREIVTERLVREKKPWAVAMAAALLLGCTVNYFGYWNQWRSADMEEFEAAFRTATNVQQISSTQTNNYSTATDRHTGINKIGETLTGNIEGRFAWLEVLKAVDASLPRDPNGKDKDIGQRRELHIEALDCQKFDDLGKWFQYVEMDYRSDHGLETSGVATPRVPAPEVFDDNGDLVEVPFDQTGFGPHGEGWVIELRGHHFYNEDLNTKGAVFIRQTLLKRLNEGTVDLPEGTVSLKDLGIGYPVLVDCPNPYATTIPDEDAIAAAAAKASDPVALAAAANDPIGGRMALMNESPEIKVEICYFIVQFCWQKVPPSRRGQSAPPATGPGGPTDNSAAAAETATPDDNADLATNQPPGN